MAYRSPDLASTRSSADQPPQNETKPTVSRSKRVVAHQTTVVEIEKLLETYLGELLERHASKINEGNNGVIFRIPVFEVPPELREALRKRGINLENDRVFKVLKIYTLGIAQSEFGLQDHAYRAVKEARDRGEDVARVPEPFFARDITVQPELVQKLRNAGVRLRGDQAGVIMMDFVEGEDLATMLYREVLRKRGYGQVDDMPLREVMEQVAAQLDFRRPGGKARDEVSRVFEERKIEMENAEKLFRFLEKSGFTIHPAIADQLDRTIRVLHKAGLLWRDGHERNIMINGPLSGAQPPDLHVIDFGGSRRFEGAISRELYLDDTPFGVHQSRDDFDIVRILRRFAARPEGKPSLGSGFVEQARQRMERDKIFRMRVEQARLLPASQALAQGFGFYSTGDAITLFSPFVFALLEKGHVSKDAVRTFVSSKVEQLETGRVAETLGKLLKAVEMVK